jgi:acyl carrier protein
MNTNKSEGSMSSPVKDISVETLRKEDVLAFVCAELTKLVPLSQNQVRSDSDLATELNIDSLDAMTLVLALNRRYGVDLPEEVEVLRTPEKVTDTILALTEAKSRLSAFTQPS